MKRILSLFLALCAVPLLCAGVRTSRASAPMASSGKPYYIMVNRAQSTVTVYELDGEGYYTVPVKAMVCSTGREGYATPTGTFTIGGRWTWVHMFDDSYGQYCTQIKGNILFHSVCYTEKDPSTLMTEEYNGLGAPASLGCVRLQTADAKWIYDNCARGTKVTIYDGGDPGPLGKPDKLVPHISEEQANGWDPTDPREENPWHALLSGQGEGGPPPEPLPPAQAGADEGRVAAGHPASEVLILLRGRTDHGGVAPGGGDGVDLPRHGYEHQAAPRAAGGLPGVDRRAGVAHRAAPDADLAEGTLVAVGVPLGQELLDQIGSNFFHMTPYAPRTMPTTVPA